MHFPKALFVFAALIFGVPASGQEKLTLISLKNGESMALGTVTWILTSTCAPLFQDVVALDMFEGPSQLKLRYENGRVRANGNGCVKEVPGVIVYVTADGVTEKIDTTITYRVTLKTKAGVRQVTHRYRILAFP